MAMETDRPYRNEDVEKAREEQKLRRAVDDTQLTGDIQALLATEGGRRIARMLMAWTHVFGSVVPSTNERMAFESGQRDIGVRWLELLVSKDPKGYLKTIEEHINAPGK